MFKSHFSPSSVSEVGNYSLLKTIGQGSFGKVKLALHKLTNTICAVKIVDKMYSPAVSREIDTWRMMKHPNISQLYVPKKRFTWSQNIGKFAPNSCDGGEAFEYILHNGKLDERTCRHVFKQIVDAVAYCHDKQFVHRDLDFGFTRAYKGGRLLDTYCGSTAYAAPEMLLKEKYSGPAADIWSLGVILYTLICGYLPFDDENEAEIHKRIMAVEYEVPNFLSEQAADLLSRILKSNQPDRITIPELLNHPFLNSSSTETSIPEYIPSVDLKRDSEKCILEAMEKLGFDTMHVIDSVKSHACNQASALFHLLLIKKVEGNGLAAPSPSFSGKKSIMIDLIKPVQDRRGSRATAFASVPVAPKIQEEDWNYEN